MKLVTLINDEAARLNVKPREILDLAKVSDATWANWRKGMANPSDIKKKSVEKAIKTIAERKTAQTTAGDNWTDIGALRQMKTDRETVIQKATQDIAALDVLIANAA